MRTYATLQKQGGQLKMVNLNQRLADLFKVTGLQKAFDIYEDEGRAIQAFGRSASLANA
jgi:anti-anti-sigma factor